MLGNYSVNFVLQICKKEFPRRVAYHICVNVKTVRRIVNQLAEKIRDVEPTFIVTYKNKLNRIFHCITKNFVKASDFLPAASKVYHKQWK
jgi:hypothetical protein